MLIGYARVSTIEQNLDLQIDALKNIGCKKLYATLITLPQHLAVNYKFSATNYMLYYIQVALYVSYLNQVKQTKTLPW